jgi:hypothetical protein
MDRYGVWIQAGLDRWFFSAETGEKGE